MFVRKSSYDTVVADRDRLASKVALLTEQLARSNGEINSLKNRLDDVSVKLVKANREITSLKFRLDNVSSDHRLTEQLARANGEINSLKFRLNDVSIRLDHMVKAEAKKVVEERGVSFDIVSVKPQSKPVPPIGRTTRES